MESVVVLIVIGIAVGGDTVVNYRFIIVVLVSVAIEGAVTLVITAGILLLFFSLALKGPVKNHRAITVVPTFGSSGPWVPQS